MRLRISIENFYFVICSLKSDSLPLFFLRFQQFASDLFLHFLLMQSVFGSISIASIERQAFLLSFFYFLSYLTHGCDTIFLQTLW